MPHYHSDINLHFGGACIILDKYTIQYNTNNFIQFLQQTYLWITYHRIITKEEII